MSDYDRGVNDERGRCVKILRDMVETAQMELDGVGIYGLDQAKKVDAAAMWSSAMIGKAYALTALQLAEAAISNQQRQRPRCTAQ